MLQQSAKYPIGIRVAHSGIPAMDFITVHPMGLFSKKFNGPDKPPPSIPNISDRNSREGEGSVEVIKIAAKPDAADWTKTHLGGGLDVCLMQTKHGGLVEGMRDVSDVLGDTDDVLGAISVFCGGALMNLQGSAESGTSARDDVDALSDAFSRSIGDAPFLKTFPFGTFSRLRAF